MKKKTIFQCVILFFSILNIHVGMAGPEQVSMHIYGNVVDQGCDVATKSALQNIHIGDFNISDFQAANTVSTAADLNIDITGCAAGITGADVLFSGEADTLAPTLLKLTDTGGSGGMATGPTAARPKGVLVSKLSLIDTKSTSFFRKTSSIRYIVSFCEREIRSSLYTKTLS